VPVTDSTSGIEPVQAVTFDFWNTIVAEHAVGPRSGGRISEVLNEHGVAASSDEVKDAFFAGWKWFETRWADNVHTTTRESVAASLGALPTPVVDAAVIDAVTQIVVDGADPSTMTIAPGIGDCLESLSAAGVRIGIICDVGMTPSSTLRGYLSHHGLLDYFNHWSFSDEVGCYKPDQRIFAHAAEGLGLPDPAHTAHVGDLRRTDVAGAQTAGWISVRYKGLSDDSSAGPEADHVLDHHDELPAALGLL